jgi:hypothetical protein
MSCRRMGLWGVIAGRFGTTVAALMAVNPEVSIKGYPTADLLGFRWPDV